MNSLQGVRNFYSQVAEEFKEFSPLGKFLALLTMVGAIVSVVGFFATSVALFFTLWEPRTIGPPSTVMAESAEPRDEPAGPGEDSADEGSILRAEGTPKSIYHEILSAANREGRLFQEVFMDHFKGRRTPEEGWLLRVDSLPRREDGRWAAVLKEHLDDAVRVTVWSDQDLSGWQSGEMVRVDGKLVSLTPLGAFELHDGKLFRDVASTLPNGSASPGDPPKSNPGASASASDGAPFLTETSASPIATNR